MFNNKNQHLTTVNVKFKSFHIAVSEILDTEYKPLILYAGQENPECIKTAIKRLYSCLYTCKDYQQSEALLSTK